MCDSRQHKWNLENNPADVKVNTVFFFVLFFFFFFFFSFLLHSQIIIEIKVPCLRAEK